MSTSVTAENTSMRRRLTARMDWRSNIIYIAFVVVFILFAVMLGNDGFLSGNNLLNIARQTATISIMAIAMTFVIAAAEIDLSVGSIAGLSSVVTAITVTNFGLVPGILAGLASGAVIGAVNGGLVALLNIPSFLVTLGMLGLAAGIAQWITGSAPQPITDDVYVMIFGGGDFGPVPGLLVWTAVIVALGWVIMNRSRYGRKVLATGGNPTAARFTGINTARIKFTVLLVSGIVAAFAGMLYAGRLESGRFQWGQGDELTVIAAVILGGTSLFGGRGAIIGTLFGSLFMGLVNNGLILAGLDVAQQQVVRGAIIIAAVALSRKK
ncbi:MAG: ABC transporter permease [Actinobacteria bacterium]|jgi:ribose transport system permease protein|uniref:ABC transporter permease n=1 Tax=unclassified Microbacterium TaxID=2609290 RepID=UPI000C538FF2|nr:MULTISPECIES: ABC transporter permease [unclassified Microbacterium]MBU19234.1 ABC transporter permease [Microbacterium sp.]RUA26571.1 MAG: ABC transporter permease [Actinomycetota bacterium]HBS08608.1 ABC transporter permease [Microbacterium sp.]HBU43078.1 ABC transporter permease [Microbacterium sp.]|tara:strand:- start:219 stop:1190 length:972 start_codon:yes stop_codon:yes gene_type:complete